MINEARILASRPFSSFLEIERVEAVGEAAAHSGSAFFVTAKDGRRFKLRACESAARAREIERYLRSLPDLLPRLIGREGSFLLVEALDDHRRVTRHEMLQRATEIGRLCAIVHRTACPPGLLGAFRKRWVAAKSFLQFLRDLALLRRRGILPPEQCAAIRGRYRAYRTRFGLPVSVEIDDIHKGNLMVRESDGDLRFVDEEGIALRPKGTGLATLLKTTKKRRYWDDYRRGYAEVADPSFITPEYTDYLLLMDTVRRVAYKVRTGSRAEKLPDDIADLRALFERDEPSFK